MKYFVTGDCHGRFNKVLNYFPFDEENKNNALIILGDTGLNYYLNNTDRKSKMLLQNTGLTFYLVRGNHEERPENISTMIEWYDPEIQGVVYREEDFPNIRYLVDGCIYLFNGYRALVVGGAYSVDKWYRLNGHKHKDGWTGWFKDEQLYEEEMNYIFDSQYGNNFDFVLSHTCPYSWQPFDLFLNGIDQSTVDNSMELWMDKLKDSITWTAWLFGHFHDDRLVRPGVEMYMNDTESLDTIYERWTCGREPDWWLRKDPKYYEGVENNADS